MHDWPPVLETKRISEATRYLTVELCVVLTRATLHGWNMLVRGIIGHLKYSASYGTTVR